MMEGHLALGTEYHPWNMGMYNYTCFTGELTYVGTLHIPAAMPENIVRGIQYIKGH